MKKSLCLIISILMILTLFTSCGNNQNGFFSAYTEVCDTSGYYPADISLPLELTNFSVGSYGTLYGSYNGSVCKFLDTGELRITYADTLGFSAPYFYDGYVYAVSNGCLYKIDSSMKGTITQIGEKLDGTGANCVVVNDSFALITLHHYDENGKFSIKLMRVDLATGEAQELDLGTEQRLYCSAGGVMYVYTKETVDREEVYSLYEIPTDGKPIYICDMTDVGEVARFVLEEGTFYYGGANGDLCAKSLITGEISTCVSSAGIYDMGQFSETGMTFSNGSIIYYNANTACIESVYTPDFGANGRKIVTVASTRTGDISHIDMSALESLSGELTINHEKYTEEEMITKILAGDDDVDIYFVSDTIAKMLLDRNIYIPIESEIVKDFNESCFDYIADYCLSESGETALMPISNYVYGMLYPLEAQEEVGFEREDLLYYDSFMELAKNHGTDRYVFQYGEIIHNCVHMQYAEYYCDFEHGEFDFTTDLYKRLFAELWTYSDFSIRKHSVFAHPNYIDDERYPNETDIFGKPIPSGTIHYYPETVLFSTGYFTYYSYVNPYNCPTFAQEWRAVPMPRISEKVKGNYTEAEFAYVNPYSQRKESAEYFLEAIAENYMKVRGGQAKYSFLLEDKSAYSSDYYPQSQVFNDFYDIAADGFIFAYNCGFPDNRGEYAKGLVTLEDTLNDYQRQVEIRLNE